MENLVFMMSRILSIDLKRLLVGLCFFAVGLIFGCNTDSEIRENQSDLKETETGQQTTREDNDEPLNITSEKTTTITFYAYINNNEHEVNIKQLIQEFEDRHPQIKVELVSSSKDEFISNAEKWLVSETSPDIMTFYGGEELLNYAEKNLLTPLNGVFKGGYDKDFPTLFKEHIGLNGTQYLLPMGWEWFIFYYNKKLFNEYSYSVPESWDDFVNLCEDIRDKGLVPVSIGTKDNMIQLNTWFDYLILKLKGQSFYNDFISGDIEFTSADVVEMFNSLKNLTEKGIINKDYASLTMKQAVGMLDNGDAMMSFLGQSSLSYLNSLDPYDDLGYFPFPGSDRGSNAVKTHIEGLIIPEKSPNKAQARMFVEFMSTKEVQSRYNEITHIIPANKKTIFENLHSEDLMDEILNKEKTILGYQRSSPEDIAEFIGDRLSSIINGSEDIDSFLFDLEKERRRVIEGEDVSEMLRANILVYSDMNSGKGKNLFQSIINRFKKDNPYINITVNYMDEAEITGGAETWLKSNNPPDIISIQAGEQFTSLVKEGLIEPIGGIFSDGFDKHFHETFRNAVSIDNNIYMVPKSFDWFSVYYRKGFFDDYDLEVPLSFKEFLSICYVIELRRAYPIAIGTKDGNGLSIWFDYINLRKNGIDFYNKFSSGEISFTDPKVVSVFDTLADMVEKGYFMPDHNSFTVREAVYEVFRKNAGFYLGGGFVHDLAEGFEEIYYIKHELEYFKFPPVNEEDPDYELTSLDGFVLSSGSADKEAAMRFLKFLSRVEIQQDFADELDAIVSGKDISLPNNIKARVAREVVLSSDSSAIPTESPQDNGFWSLMDNKLLDILDSSDSVSNIIAELEVERQRYYNR